MYFFSFVFLLVAPKRAVLLLVLKRIVGFISNDNGCWSWVMWDQLTHDRWANCFMLGLCRKPECCMISPVCLCWTILLLDDDLWISISFEWLYQISSVFHHLLKANILRFAHLLTEVFFLPILLSFVAQKL